MLKWTPLIAVFIAVLILVARTIQTTKTPRPASINLQGMMNTRLVAELAFVPSSPNSDSTPTLRIGLAVQNRPGNVTWTHTTAQ